MPRFKLVVNQNTREVITKTGQTISFLANRNAKGIKANVNLGSQDKPPTTGEIIRSRARAMINII